jgi:hypothetical protein
MKKSEVKPTSDVESKPKSPAHRTNWYTGRCECDECRKARGEEPFPKVPTPTEKKM